MTLERLLLWVRRNALVFYILAAAAVVAVAVLLWYFYEPVAAAKVWGVTHHNAAVFHGSTLRLPEGWREEDGVARSDLHLDRPYVGRDRVEVVDVDELTGADTDFERMVNTLRSVEALAADAGDVAAEYPLSDANRGRFVCMEHDSPDHAALHVTCLSRDGHRVVRMVGTEDARAAFAAILTGLGAIPAVKR